MNLTNQPAYQARHPNAVFVTPEFPHGAAALNALFDRDMWERDEDVDTGIADETIDIDTEEGREGLRRVAREPKPLRRAALRWRAPVETLKGPCSLWKETHTVTPEVEAINASRAYAGLPPLAADHPSLQPKSYTAYKLVCEVNNLLDGDFQTLTRIADRHNCSLGAEAIGDKVLLQLAFVR